MLENLKKVFKDNYGKDADFSSIEDTCLSVRSLMLLDIDNLRQEQFLTHPDSMCNEKMANRLELYASMLDVK